MTKKINAIVLEFDNRIKNGRIYYSKDVIEEAVKNFNKDKNNTRLGKIASSQSINDLDPVDFSQATHKIDRLEFDGDKLVCDAEILDTPNGKAVQEVFNAGFNPKFAPRMIGEPIYELDENGNPTNKIVGYKNVKIISVDIV